MLTGEKVAARFVEIFAEDFAEAPTIKRLIIAERNTAISSCILTMETQTPIVNAAGIYKRALEEHDRQPTGLIEVTNWRSGMRNVAANMEPASDPYIVLARMSFGGNPYRDVSRAFHPSSRQVA